MAASIKSAEADLRSFLSFFELKRARYVHDLAEVVDDVMLERAVDDMFSRDDVEGMFEAAADAVRSKADSFMEQQVNMAALVIEQVYTAALDSGVTVALDMSKVEDERMLREVGKLNEERLTALRSASAGQAKLATLGARKSALEEQLAALEEEVRALKEDNARLAVTNSGLAAEVTRLGGSVDAAAAAGAGSDFATLQDKLAERETQLAEAQALLSGVSAEVAAANERITSTKQFQQMRAMLHKKNDTITALRTRLLAFDATAFDDEADSAAGSVVHK